jgi:hypothetical protein
MPFGTLTCFYSLWRKECSQVLWFTTLELWCFLFLSILAADFWRTVGSLDHPSTVSQIPNLKTLRVSQYISISDYLFWDSWTNFLACVTVPGVLQYAYITWYESKRSSLPFVVPWQHSFNKRECWRIYICSLCTLVTLKENGWRGICYFSGPEFLFCKILF